MKFYKHKRSLEIIIVAFLCLFLQAVLIVSDVLTFKVARLAELTFTLPALLYPLTYSIGDILTEVYGKRATLTIFFMAIGIEALFDILISYAATIKNVYDSLYYAAFHYALSKMDIAALGVVTGSILGFTFNTIIMQFLKTKFSYRSFPLRSVFSSLAGEIVFTIIAFSIWFYSDPNVNKIEILKLIFSSILFKVLFASICAYPAYRIARILSKNKAMGNKGLKIVNIKKLNCAKEEIVFSFQVAGKRAGFTTKAQQITLNMFSALSKADQKLLEAALKGKINEHLNELMKQDDER